MKPSERRLLRFYLLFHEKRPTVGRLFWWNRRVYILSLLYFGATIAFFAVAFGWWVAGYAIAAVTAMLLRDLGYFLRTVRAWPLLDRLIDWPRAERLAASENPDTPGPDATPRP